MVYMTPPLEDQYLEIDGEYYRVEETEEMSFGKELAFTSSGASTGTVTTGTLSEFVGIEELEPHELGPPRMRITVAKASVNVGKLYIQILLGKSRRGTRRKPSPSSSLPLIGDVDIMENPEYNPTLGFMLLNREVPAFAVFGDLGFDIQPRITIRGIKMTTINIAQLKPGSIPRQQEILDGLRNGTIPHKRVTKMGLAEE